MPDHALHMKHAIALGARHQGRTGVNPSVGCVIVKQGKIVGRGITSPGGRPHAEMNALIMAGKKADKATAYVTLEPCAHEGSTPSCARIMAESGIKHVVIAVKDPDERTKGKGSDILEAAGVKVITGVETDLARGTMCGYLSCKEKGRPYYQLKMGITDDFKIAEKRGFQSNITGPLSRNYAMLLRSKCDGILVGIDTVLVDDPQLTVRIEGIERTSPARIILDSAGRMPITSQMIKTADKVPVILCVSHDNYENTVEKFQNTDVEIIECGSNSEGIDLIQLSQKLAQLQIGKIMIEGGSKIAASFIKNELIDEIALFKSEKIFGENAVDALEGIDLSAILQTYKKSDVKRLGLDTIARYKK